jgi:SAM-dependent methyltransferase
MATAQERGFWFRARNRLIADLVGQLSQPGDRFLEVGCGSGYVLQAVVETCGVKATGTDSLTDALERAQRLVPEAEFRRVDVVDGIYQEEFEIAGAFDVLEHIGDDLRALRSLRAAVRPGGYVLISVPQHPWLWSAFDETARHVRRYRRAELLERARQAGLEPVRVTSFVATLLPLMALSRARRRSRRGSYDPVDEMLPPRPINRLLGGVLDLERRLIRRGMNFPVGGSLILVARRSAG